ncbi:hypothetical protein HDV05_000876 [Chytridiales sp. JEL 0842]|nr:hypothetical protein HDV05_000876 [Chytridiales sp. JEL 0842]
MISRRTMRPVKVLQELRSRAIIYHRDFTDAFSSRSNFAKTLAASVYTFFTSIGPGITFSSYLFNSTGALYGVPEVLLSTSLCGIIFSLVGGQPLVIVGVTGPISVFSQTVYYLVKDRWGPQAFLPFMFWTSLWAGLMHIAIGLFGGCGLVKYVTRFSCEVFGAFIGVVYIFTAVTQMVRMSDTTPKGLLTFLLAVGTLAVGWWMSKGLRRTVMLNRQIREAIGDYAVPLTVIIVSALYYIPVLKSVNLTLLPVPPSFQPSNNRFSLILKDVFAGPLPPSAVGIALISGFVLTVLIFFDHNVSSLLAQQPHFNLKKPAAYNWDFIIVGLSMILTGILGLPPSHGLIPQAPLHTTRLAFTKTVSVPHPSDPHIKVSKEIYTHVVEQRVSNLLQSTLVLLFLLVPALLKILGSVPIAVLSGLFLIMGLEAFQNNQFAERILMASCLIYRDEDRFTAFPHIWKRIRGLPYIQWAGFTGVQVLLLGLIFGITESPAAIGFPLCILVMVPVRRYLLPLVFNKEAMEALDGEDSGEREEVVEHVEVELSEARLVVDVVV